MRTIIIKSERDKVYCQNLIKQMPLDGSCEVITKKVDKSSSAKQRRLKWKWNDEIARSGIGQYDTSKGVHIWNKKEFGHPILMRDSQFYADMFRAIRDAYQHLDDYTERMWWFVDEHIKTEKFNMKQQSEYLSSIQRFWGGHGVDLTDPATQGLDLRRWRDLE